MAKKGKVKDISWCHSQMKQIFDQRIINGGETIRVRSYVA